MPTRTGKKTFNEVLEEALKDFEEHGYDSPERLEYWERLLAQAAKDSLTPPEQMERMLREALAAVYKREVEKGGVLKMHPGIARWQLDRVKPRLRDLLDARIMASAQLIKINRAQEIGKTMQRFAGYVTSIPPGGAAKANTREQAKEIRKSLSGLSFRERRVMVDQGHKLLANVSQTIAEGGGAIAGVWRSHWRQSNYDYREDHKDRDGVFYLVRGSWAQEKGFVKPAGHQYVDQITQPGEEVFCRCFYRWVYNLRDMPKEMVTQKGWDELKRVRAQMAAA